MERAVPQGIEQTPPEVVASQFRGAWLLDAEEAAEEARLATLAADLDMLKAVGRDVVPTRMPATIVAQEAEDVGRRHDAVGSYVLFTLGTLCRDMAWALLFIGALLILQALIF